MTPTDEALLSRYLASETDLRACEALFQECLAPRDYVELTETMQKIWSEE